MSLDDAVNVDKSANIIENFYNLHIYGSIENFFKIRLCVINTKYCEIKYQYDSHTLKIIAEFITSDIIYPNMLSSLMYVLNVATITYLKTPTVEGIECAISYLTTYIEAEINKNKRARARLLLSEFYILESKYTQADAILSDVIMHSIPATIIRGHAMLIQMRLIALYTSRFADASIMVTSEYAAEIRYLSEIVCPNIDVISNSIISYVYMLLNNHEKARMYRNQAITNIIAHPGVLYLLGHIFEDKIHTMPEFIIPFYIQAANKDYMPAIIVVISHWKHAHINNGQCTCALNNPGFISSIIYYVSLMMPSDHSLQNILIQLARNHINSFKYEYKYIVGIIAHDELPKYRGANKIAHNMDLLNKQQLYLNNYYTPDVTYCEICLNDNTACYKYICNVHAFCIPCSTNISRTVTLRRCPKCAIPEHPYFKDIWTVTYFPAWKIARKCKNLYTDFII